MIMKGQKINDRYQIVKAIGEGGMANVYLAYDTILERDVAVKILRGDLATDEKFVRRFQREALSASSLNHPNIVEVYDVGEDNGQYYIVMEYIKGKHLKNLIKKRGSLTVSEVIDIMLQISDGLACAHDSYIIHRDIKPQNIMILENGLVKITDFGIAMAINSSQLTQTNSVMGSVHYLPPEQANGKGSTLKSDIYSMGILMYELLTGNLPYKGDNAVEIALKHMKDPLPSIRELTPDLPNSVENVILRSTAKNPKNRYADAREMNEDLKTVLDDSRINEPRYEYQFDEDNMDATKILKNVVKDNVAKPEEPVIKQIKDPKELKKENKVLIILGAIFVGLVVAITTVIVLLPRFTNQEELKIPDVSNMEVTEAIEELQDAGFKVADEQKEEASEDIAKGKVVKTNPAAETKRTKGTTITLYISTGSSLYEMEDFVGSNYLEAQAKLEIHNINVIIEQRDVELTPENENKVLEQSVEPGVKLGSKDTVTLYIPNTTKKYPSFVGNGSTEADVQAFCDENGIKLEIEYVETSEYIAGEVFYQSRPEGYTVADGQTLKIRVAKEESSSGEEVDCDVPGLC